MATANRPAQETPSKKLGLDEPETDVKERYTWKLMQTTQ